MVLNNNYLSNTIKESAVETLKNSRLSLLSNSASPLSRTTIKIMIVDDSALMRNAISFILDSQKDFEIVERAYNGQDALDKLKKLPRSQQADVILADIEMPEMDGLTFLKHSRLRYPAKVIILSSKVLNNQSNESIAARKYGAAAVISKPSGAVSMDIEHKRGSEIIDTIRSVIN